MIKKMKKIITESLLVVTMLVFMVSPAMAAEPGDVMDNKSNVFPSDKLYAMNMTGKSGKDATATTELQITDPNTPVSDGNNANMEQLKMILLILYMPGPWQSIPMNLQ